MKYWHDIPYGLCIVKAALNKNHEVRLIDANIDNLSEDELIEKYKEYSPDVIGISCMSWHYRETLVRTAELAKKVYPNVPVVVGGVYATVLPEDVLSYDSFDYVVMGEGEYRFDKLLRCIESEPDSIKDIDGIAYKKDNKTIVNKIVSYVDELDKVPFPDYSELKFDDYAYDSVKYSYYIQPRRFPYSKMVTSRGCPSFCIFCSTNVINGRKFRFRSAENVLEEIDWMVEEYGIKEVIFSDDALLGRKKRSIEIFKGLIERNYDLIWKPVSIATMALDDSLLELMRESGCYQLPLAIESGVQETLKFIKKPLRIYKVPHIVEKAKSLGFELGGLFTFGYPHETWDQIRTTFRVAEELDLDYCSFNPVIPLPETELYKITKSEDILIPEFDMSDMKYRMGVPVIITENFKPAELLILRAFEWDRINFKTQAKVEKIAEMNGITVEDIEKWRIETRNEALRMIPSMMIQKQSMPKKPSMSNQPSAEIKPIMASDPTIRDPVRPRGSIAL